MTHVVNINTQKAPNWVNTVISTLSKRVQGALFGVSKNGKRDINDIYGYKTELTFSDLYWMYRRGGLAYRIVNGYARSSWRDGITILKDGKEVHEEELKILNRYGKMVKRLEQADILNRIGRFSVLFVGVPDGLPLDKPLGSASPARLKEVFFRPFAEDGVIIHSWVNDLTSPRHGLPEIYTLQTVDRGDKDHDMAATSVNVHWSRLVHLSEGALDSEIEGIPCLEPIFNALEDMCKTAGGAAEAYFRNARNRFSMETDPKFASSFSAADKLALEDEAMRFQNEWQDFIRAGGINIKSLNIPHASPEHTVVALFKIISGTTGYPLRVLTGEGGGQTTGSEDKEAYNQLVQDRRELVCDEWVQAILTILNNAKMMVIDDSEEISWDIPTVVSGKERAIIAKENAAALKATGEAMSTPALDGRLEIDRVLELVFGEEMVADMPVLAEDDDGLTDEEIAASIQQSMPASPAPQIPPVVEEEIAE